jgi:hypothetical protein
MPGCARCTKAGIWRTASTTPRQALAFDWRVDIEFDVVKNEQRLVLRNLTLGMPKRNLSLS